MRSERWRTYSESNRPGAGDAAVAHASRGRARRPWRGGRKYRSRGRVLVEEAESLGVNILGRPGQAIVLRDDEFERHPSELEAAEGDNAPPETLTDGSQPMQEELVKLLEDEGQSVSWEEVRANIEALRPQPSVGTSSLSLPTGAFNELLKKLHNGFTQRQLLTYFKTYDVGEAVATTAKKESGDAGAVVATPGLLRTLPWAPIADAPLDRELRMHKTSKGKLARKILSDCWGLVEADPADTLGTATLFLEPSNLLLPPREHALSCLSHSLKI